MTDCQTSIIVPIYNAEKHLRECLGSLVAQTVDNYEVILIDDGSTDASGAIAKRFADLFDYFRYVPTDNLGPGAARNLGLSLANGEFIAFVDSDDWVSEKYLAELIEPLRRDPELDVTICGFRLIAHDGSDMPGDCEALAYLSSVTAYLHSGHECYPWNKCFRRALFADRQFYVGRFDDLSLVPYLLCASRKQHFVREVLYQYRQRAGSLSNTPRDEKHLFQVFAAIEHLKRLGAASGNKRWSSYEVDQLPNHGFAYRIRELLSLAARSGGGELLNRYSESLELTLPGWSRSPATRRWLRERVWWKQVALRVLVEAMRNRSLRSLAVAGAIAWKVAGHEVLAPTHSAKEKTRSERGGDVISTFEIVECRGIAVAVDPRVMSKPTIGSLEAQQYEIDEERELRHLIEDKDVVLEVGGGCGFISTFCALRKDVSAVFCVEANPLLIPIIVETHRLNQVHVTVYNEVLGRNEGMSDFYLHEDFWSSAKTAFDKGRRIQVKMTSFQSRLDQIKPSLLVVDIEGGEVELFEGVDLPSSLKRIFVEIHQDVIGGAGVKKVFDALSSRGFHYDQWHSHRSVVTFTRVSRQ